MVKKQTLTTRLRRLFRRPLPEVRNRDRVEDLMQDPASGELLEELFRRDWELSATDRGETRPGNFREILRALGMDEVTLESDRVKFEDRKDTE